MATKKSKASIAPTPEGVATTKFRKEELLASPALNFSQRLFMRLALNDDEVYTVDEAKKAIEKFKKASIK
jgi:hypothetical protein